DSQSALRLCGWCVGRGRGDHDDAECCRREERNGPEPHLLATCANHLRTLPHTASFHGRILCLGPRSAKKASHPSPMPPRLIATWVLPERPRGIWSRRGDCRAATSAGHGGSTSDGQRPQNRLLQFSQRNAPVGPCALWPPQRGHRRHGPPVPPHGTGSVVVPGSSHVVSPSAGRGS